MNQIETKHVIAALAEHFIIRGHHNKTTLNGDPDTRSISVHDGIYAMRFCIAFDMQNHGYEKDGSTHHKDWERRFLRRINVIITQRHNVFVAVTNGRNEPQLSDWLNTSNHDSCWRSDGLNVMDEVAWDAYEHCFGFMPDPHRPIPALASSFVQFANWYFGKAPFEIVKVKAIRSTNTDRYDWTLSEIKNVDYQVNILDPEARPEITDEPV